MVEPTISLKFLIFFFLLLTKISYQSKTKIFPNFSKNILPFKAPHPDLLVASEFTDNSFTTYSGWSMTNIISSAYTDCGAYGRHFGGYGKFGNYNQISKTYSWTNVAHYGLLVTLKLLKIDSWEATDWLDVYVNGVKQERITSDLYDGPDNQCGNGVNDKMISLSYSINPHTSSSVQIKFISNFNEPLTNESWGIREIYIYLKMCDTTCLSCSGGSSFECQSCPKYATLRLSGECVFSTYYFLKDANWPCTSNPCTSCTRCDVSCLTCNGPSSSNCLSCEIQDTFSNTDMTCTYPTSNKRKKHFFIFEGNINEVTNWIRKF